MQFLYFFPLLLAACPALSARAATSRLQIQTKPAIPQSLVHTKAETLPTTHNILQPSSEEITWLKSLATNAPLPHPKKVRLSVQAEIAKLLEAGRTAEFLVITPDEKDPFYLQLRFHNASTPVFSVQTHHDTCPGWIEQLIRSSIKKTTTGVRNICLTAIAGTCGLGMMCPAARRHRNNGKQPYTPLTRYRKYKKGTQRKWDKATDERTIALKRIKTSLITTPFFNFIVGKVLGEPAEADPVLAYKINQRAAEEFVQSLSSNPKNPIRKLCNGYESAYLEGTSFNLNPSECREFLMGSLKEETVDFLAQFQRNYSAGFKQDWITAEQQESLPDNSTNAKEVALRAFVLKIKELQTSDRIEAKRILCLHPHLLPPALPQRPDPRFFSSSHNRPAAVGPELDGDYPHRFPSFGSILRNTLKGKYCLRDNFPGAIAMFEDLHKVSATSLGKPMLIQPTRRTMEDQYLQNAGHQGPTSD